MKDIINDLSEYLGGFFPLFVSIIAHPHATVRALVPNPDHPSPDIYKRPIMFAILALCIGTAIGSYLKISGGPPLFDITTIISAILIWTLAPLVLHPVLRLFGGAGSIHSTIAVFLLIVSSLHLIWVPIVAMVSIAAPNTMDYHYLLTLSEVAPIYPFGNPDPLSNAIVFIAVSLYFLSHFFYLSHGLSAVHSKPWCYWFFLAIVGPPALIFVLSILAFVIASSVPAYTFA